MTKSSTYQSLVLLGGRHHTHDLLLWDIYTFIDLCGTKLKITHIFDPLHIIM